MAHLSLQQSESGGGYDQPLSISSLIPDDILDISSCDLSLETVSWSCGPVLPSLCLLAKLPTLAAPPSSVSQHQLSQPGSVILCTECFMSGVAIHHNKLLIQYLTFLLLLTLNQHFQHSNE